MMPGVTSAGGNNAFNARINGGIITGDEAIVDGVTTSEGFMNQRGMVALQTDFGMSPDITSEVHILTANYDAQYGNTTSGQLIIQTKSGSEQFHGGGYEYIRNDFFNAIQYGNSTRPPTRKTTLALSLAAPGMFQASMAPIRSSKATSTSTGKASRITAARFPPMIRSLQPTPAPATSAAGAARYGTRTIR